MRTYIVCQTFDFIKTCDLSSASRPPCVDLPLLTIILTMVYNMVR